MQQISNNIHIRLADPPMATASIVEPVSERPMAQVDKGMSVHSRNKSTVILWIE